MKILGLLLTFLITSSCAPFRDSPFSDQLIRKDRELNSANHHKLNALNTGTKIKIAIFADSHQNYKDLDRVVFRINQSDVDFVVGLGDFTNSGYNLEYDQFLDSYVRINKPTFTVLGNHDAIGAGPSLFRKVFGPVNYYFEWNSYRFILFHSANWENPEEFNSSWLKQTVDESNFPIIIFTHASLRDPERYFEKDAINFDEVIKNAKVKMVINGHNHVYWLGNDNNTTLLQSPRVEQTQWLQLEIENNQALIKQMATGEATSISLKN
ncbi:MAG: metallophosphoesterase [Bdellovibrionaceae bacterium]|nr:metallophosphoesterase [Pseudobdellovibrionaceae bacterium]